MAEAGETFAVAKTETGTWQVTLTASSGEVLESWVTEHEPSPETLRALRASATEHQDALRRLVHR